MNGPSLCPNCGAPLADAGPAGNCPNCLFALAMAVGTGQGQAEAAAAPEPLPSRAPGTGAATAAGGVVPLPPNVLHYFGDYELLEEIARGGMGVVYRARQVSLNRIVAVKVLLFGQFASDEFVRRFRTEAEAAANLHHPNIVAIHEIGEHDGRQYFSMDYVAGGHLGGLVRDKPLPAKSAAALLKTIAEAVHHAHERGVLHRDLKPSNVLMDASGQPRLTDFGLAKRFDTNTPQPAHELRGSGRESARSELEESQSRLTSAAAELTITGQMLGTPSYASPEQVGGRRGAVTAASDVYSLGAVLYFLLTGRPPFLGENLEDTIHQVLEIDPVRPRLLNPSLSRDLETICLKCLEKEPDRRFSTARELAEELTRFLDGEPIQARPVGVAGKVWRWGRRRPLVAGLVVALHVVLAIGLAGILWQWREARRAQRETTEKLWDAYLAQARASRFSGRPGRRNDSLNAVSRAVAIRPSPELRDEAIAALALFDVRVTNQWTFPQEQGDIGFIYSPNLDFFSVNGTNGGGRLHRTADNAEIGRLPSVGQTINGLGAFTPDGRWMAAQGAYSNLYIWNVPERRLAFTNLSQTAWGFTPDSRQVLVSDGRRAALYDLELGRLARRYPPETVFRGPAAIEPQGRWFAGSAVTGSVVTVFDFATGKSLRSFTNTAGVMCLAWSPKGDSLVVGGAEGMLTVWDAQTGERRARLEGHEGTVVVVGFNRAGTLLASSSWDNSWRMWDAREWQPLLTFPSISYHVQFSPDDRTVAYVMGQKRAGLLTVTDDGCFRVLPPSRRVINSTLDLDVSRDGRLAVAALSDGFALWDLVAERELAVVPAGYCVSAVFLPDGNGILTSGRQGIERWPLDRTTQEEREEIRVGQSEIVAEHFRRYVAVSADGRYAAAPYEHPQPHPEQIEVFAPEEPTQPIVLGRHIGASSVAFSPDARWLATGTRAGEGLKVWNLSERRLERELAVMSATVEFSPDGRWLVAGTHPLQVWATNSWREQWRYDRHDSNVPWSWTAFSPDSQVLAVVDSGRDITLLEAATGRVLARLEAPGRPALSRPRFTPDGTKLVALQHDRALQIWDLRRLREELRVRGLDW